MRARVKQVRVPVFHYIILRARLVCPKLKPNKDATLIVLPWIRVMEVPLGPNGSPLLVLSTLVSPLSPPMNLKGGP